MSPTSILVDFEELNLRHWDRLALGFGKAIALIVGFGSIYRINLVDR